MPRNLRTHILHIASELFYRQGIQATGIDTIVKTCGIAKMSLYKYFPSKEDLILAHLTNSADNMRTQLIAELNIKTCTPQEKLLYIFDFFSVFIADKNFRGCPFINATAEFADTNNPIQAASAKFYEEFGLWLADLAKQAKCSNPDQLGKQLVLLLTGAMVQEQMKRDSGALQLAYAAAKTLVKNSLNQ